MLAIFMISDINLPLLQIYLFLISAVFVMISNLAELFLVSQKELLILFLDLHSIKKWVSNIE